MPLSRMKGQRRQHQAGDVFVLQPEGDAYRFGRIVKTGESGAQGRFPGGILAYVYDVRGEGQEPDLGALTTDRLLLPPFFTIPWLWQKGYFRTVAHEEIEEGHLLAQHCFFDPGRQKYVDENDKVIPGRVEPCGWFALASFQQFEHELDEALAGRPVAAPYPQGG